MDIVELVAGKGLGDAIMLRCVVIYLLKHGREVRVYTPWMDVFEDLACANLQVIHRPELQDRNREGVLNATYQFHNRDPYKMTRNMWQLVCIGAQISEDAPFDMRWKVKEPELVDKLHREARGKPILVYQPIKRWKNLEQRLLRPNAEEYRKLISSYGDYFRIRIGHPRWLVKDDLTPCEKDMFGAIPISRTFDICSAADLLVGEPSFINVIAEAMDKSYVCMFTRRAMECKWSTRIACVTPERVICSELGTAVIDGSA